MKTVITVLVSMIFSFNVLSTEPVRIVEFSNTEWVSVFNEGGVEIFYRVQKCTVRSNQTLQEYIFVKINNSNNKSVNLDFDFSVKYGENESLILNTKHKTIKLQKNQIIEGACNSLITSNKLKIHKIYKNNDSGAILSEILLNNIIIE